MKSRGFQWLLVRPLVYTTLIALVLGLSSTVTISPLSADEETRISSAYVTVEPEYDDPRVLVIQQGTFTGSGFPQDVNFYLPLGVELTEVCGLKKPDDEHLCQLYQTRVEGNVTVLTYKLPVPDYYFEFYYNPAQGVGNRELAYSYLPSYPTDNLQVAIQQPLRTSGFTISPSSNQVASDAQGFKYYQYNFSGLVSQKSVDLNISYQKSDDRPSVPKKTTGANASGGTDDKTGLVALAISGAGALGFLGYLAVRRRPETPQVTSRRATAVPVPTGGRAAQPRTKPRGGSPAFCSKCGSSLQGDENFCPGCGQQVRRSGRRS